VVARLTIRAHDPDKVGTGLPSRPTVVASEHRARTRAGTRSRSGGSILDTRVPRRPALSDTLLRHAEVQYVAWRADRPSRSTVSRL